MKFDNYTEVENFIKFWTQSDIRKCLNTIALAQRGSDDIWLWPLYKFLDMYRILEQTGN